VAQLGEMLKRTREQQGLSLDEVARVTHIQLRLLDALEKGNFKVFPSPVIARGLIRNYAKFLGIEPTQALTLFDGHGVVPVKGQRLTPNGIEFMNLSMSSRSIMGELLVGVALVLLAVGALSYLIYTNVAPASLTAATQTPLPAGLTADSALLLPTVTPLPTNTPTPLPPTATPTPIVYSGVMVDLVAKQSSWVQILTDDVKVFEGILQPGDKKSWNGQRHVAVRAGNGGGVEVIVNGTSQGLMGEVGKVVDRLYEKVDNPAELTPQPGLTITPSLTVTGTPTVFKEPPPTPTPSPTAAAPTGETPLPLQSAPTGQ